MCTSIADGGRRCAAHTRPEFEAAVTAVATATSRTEQARRQVEGLDAIAHHAMTPAGAKEIAALVAQAEQDQNHLLVDFLNAGQQIGTQKQAVATQIEADITTQSTASATIAAPEDFDYGTPNTNVGEHWSIAEGGDRWHAGGCGAFAIALTERWPHLKIACEMYHDHGAESVAHAWAYDPDTGHRFHIFGAEQWTPTTRPDYDPDSHRVLLNQTPDDVRRLFRGFNTSEDHVFDAMDVVCEMFDPDYERDDDYDRNHLYF